MQNFCEQISQETDNKQTNKAKQNIISKSAPRVVQLQKKKKIKKEQCIKNDTSKKNLTASRGINGTKEQNAHLKEIIQKYIVFSLLVVLH